MNPRKIGMILAIAWAPGCCCGVARCICLVWYQVETTINAIKP